jgi:hypothetical protein
VNLFQGCVRELLVSSVEQMLLIESQPFVLAGGAKFLMENPSASSLLVLSKILVARKQSFKATFQSDATLFCLVASFFLACNQYSSNELSPSAISINQFWRNPAVSVSVEVVVWEAIVFLSAFDQAEAVGLHTFFPPLALCESHSSDLLRGSTGSNIDRYIKSHSQFLILQASDISCFLASKYPALRAFSLWVACEISANFLKSALEFTDSTLRISLELLVSVPRETFFSEQLRRRIQTSCCSEFLCDVLSSSKEYAELAQSFAISIFSNQDMMSDDCSTSTQLRENSFTTKTLTSVVDVTAAVPLCESNVPQLPNIQQNLDCIEHQILLLLLVPEDCKALKDAFTFHLSNCTTRSVLQTCINILNFRFLVTEFFSHSPSYATVLIEFLYSALQLIIFSSPVPGLLPSGQIFINFNIHLLI